MAELSTPIHNRRHRMMGAQIWSSLGKTVTEISGPCIYAVVRSEMRHVTTELVNWVARQILPHEPELRRWLRAGFPGVDVDDVVQEAYCRLAALADFKRVEDPRRYLFQTARNVVLTELRRARVVRIEAVGTIADLELALAADHLSPERIVAGRGLLAKVEHLLAALPERSRTIFRMRKVEGLSQRHIAEELGVTEMIVENDLARGLKIILSGLSTDDRADLPSRNERNRNARPS
ncbi:MULTISPECIES: sigma-70 family RNA polymerase sigma factor [unclassified Sphingomonas]|jgi:RNA polymerase sigma factor (sigma-70 family)|uniref:RNA polymerase sigma factor n=1 Tax=unclassified Sphingomonas TaxID=196159 RepID=UPI0008F0ED4A|nr:MULTISPECIES: sigma-70 family RNA polymerase sigma factor [unclassified Sphingomonas]RKE54345.1 RNA polymerase sigma-70 factor (ECF subfamily) [Sphingomonas sp. PP-CC-1A-547]TCM01264.1 RNA polymerase sigma-70 factor (ECF subfamily) [Sphingomonas sp. PP-CC-3G-468]SFO30794.1 RNA polymerase sigma-70 factor, ECF subfamily [Sphingomonas sp. OK281]